MLLVYRTSTLMYYNGVHMNVPLFIFQLIVLVFSVIIHEISHGFVAERLGDPTARNAGRLTLNPIKHIDPIGSIALPLLLSLIPGGVVFGWAKPVPYDPRFFKKPKRDAALVAAAGPVSNFILAAIFAAVFHIFGFGSFGELLSLIVVVNIALAIFNLVPIPPLDGSKILFGFFPRKWNKIERTLEQYGFFFFLIFIMFGIDFIAPGILWVARLFLLL